MDRRPPNARLGVTTVLFALFCLANLPVFADAQQQHSPQQHGEAYDKLQRGKSTWTEGRENDAIPLEQRQHQNKNNNDAAIRTTNVRALETFTPSGRLDDNGDVRAFPARSTTGLSANQLLPRSLQDWEVEDIVLLATVHGTIYAKERKTGRSLWAFEMERPMVDTIYHDNNQSEAGGPETTSSARDFYWIVEPSQDGALYGYSPASPPFGMHALGLTVKELVEMTPYAADDVGIVYIGDKRTTLFTIDIQTGRVKKGFNSNSTFVDEDDQCVPEDDLESFEKPTCSARGTFILGRTDYTISIRSSATGKPICTINYSEWVPNVRDRDLYNQYATTKDNRYVYSLYDGRVVALDHYDGSPLEQKPRYQQKLDSPVVRVFDVARPTQSLTVNAPLVILPQPIGPIINHGHLAGEADRIFVNCTEGGSWYALSENKYPLVTDGAVFAQAMSEHWRYSVPHMGASLDKHLKKALVGVHALSQLDALPPQVPMIAGPEDLRSISDRPAFDTAQRSENVAVVGNSPAPSSSTFQTGLIIVLLALVSIFGYMSLTDRGSFRRKLKHFTSIDLDFALHPAIELKPQIQVQLQEEKSALRAEVTDEITKPEPVTQEEAAHVEEAKHDRQDFALTVAKSVQIEESDKENVRPVSVVDEVVAKLVDTPTAQNPIVEGPADTSSAISLSTEPIVNPSAPEAVPEQLDLSEPVASPPSANNHDTSSRLDELSSLSQGARSHPPPTSSEAIPEQLDLPEPVISPPPPPVDAASTLTPPTLQVPDEDNLAVSPTPTTPEPGTPKPAKKAHRGKRGGKKTKAGKDSADDVAEDVVEIVGEGVTKTGDMIEVTPTSVYDTDGKTNLNGLVFNENELPIGSGSGGTLVYKGTWEGRPVAVKRMQHVHFELYQKEIDIIQGHSEENKHVIRYKCTRQNKDFLYIGLELCQGSLYDLWGNGPLSAPPDSRYNELANKLSVAPMKALEQLADGMKYLHDFRIVHRDIKPQNILIAYPTQVNATAYPRLVISDFGLCKVLPNDTSTLLGATVAAAGTHGWKAPELINQPVTSGSQNSQSHSSLNGAEGTSGGVRKACDIFSLGCVFFYIITKGQHPFEDPEGWSGLRERNIKLNRSNFEPIEMYGPDTIDLIQWMLSPRPEDRPTAAQVLAHPFFWDPEDRLEFLSAASDKFDNENRDGTSSVLEALEARAQDIIPKPPNVITYSSIAQHKKLPNGQNVAEAPPEHNFLAILDRKFTDTLGKQRKYNGAKLADLLRALRNKYHHWDDMPDDVKAKVGEVPDGYLSYWEKKFPKLVVGVWRVTKELDLGREKRFRKWFASKGG